MTINCRTVLSIAAATNKLGIVFLIDDRPYDWDVSRTASKSPDLTHAFVLKKIAYYRPDIIVTELIGEQSRKGAYSRALVDTICRAAQNSEICWLLVQRRQPFKNKYEEAQSLATRFPELKPWASAPRRQWQTEAQRIIVFEALALALSAIHAQDSSSEQHAR